MKRILIGSWDGDNGERAVAFCHQSFDLAYFCYTANDHPSEESRKALARTLKDRFDVPTVFRFVEAYSPETLSPLFDQWVSQGTAVFDLTGADPLFAAAAAFYRCGKDDRVTLCCYDLVSGRTLLGEDRQATFLTLREHIALYGGKVISASGKGTYDFSDPVLQQEILRVWHATRSLSADWNRFCSLSFEPTDDTPRRFRRRLTKPTHKAVGERVLQAFRRQGIVTEWSFVGKGNLGSVEYLLSKACRTKELYEKGGTALELFTCLAVSRCGSFSDCATGVEVDLDGRLTHMPGDPKNELDVLAMYGNQPVFISCKSTRVTKEYLYEIQAVSRHVGGKYAIPVVVSTVPAFFAVSERAREMGVLLADDLHNASLKSMTALLAGFFPDKED